MSSENKKIEIRGESHHSARGDLESEMWTWNISVDGKYVDEERLGMRTPEARAFYNEIKPYLPELKRYDLLTPDHIPSGAWIFRMPFERMKEPEKVETIFKKYFPRAFR